MTGHKTLKELAKSNPTMLGDPVSLKAETSDTSPTENDRPNAKDTLSSKSQEHSSPVQDLKQLAPTEQDVDQNSQHVTLQPDAKQNKTLKDIAKDNMNEAQKGNKTMLGDPVSLKAETSDKDPVKDSKRRSSKL